MILWIDVLDASYTKLGDGPISLVQNVRSSAALDQAGSWSATVVADLRALAILQEKKITLIWGMDPGGPATLVGGGIIEEITARVAADGAQLLEISGGDLLSVLAGLDAGIGEYYDVHQQLLTRIASLAATWSVIQVDPFYSWRARLVHESVLAALVAGASKRDFHFRWAPRGLDARRLEFFVSPRDSGISALGDGEIEGNLNACRIVEIAEVRQAHQLINRYFVYGSGNADARLTLAAATQWPDGSSTAGTYTDGSGNSWTANPAESSITCYPSTYTYGTYESGIEFNDIGPLTNSDADVIAASNFLLEAAVQAGRYTVAPQRSYHLSVVGLRSPLLVGDQIWVDIQRWQDGQRPIDIRRFLIVLGIDVSIEQDGVPQYSLTVSTAAAWPVSDMQAMVQAVQAGVVSRAYPQLNANSYVQSYTKNVDGPTQSASFRFRLGSEVTQVTQVLFEFQVLQLESTVRSVAAQSTSASNGGGSTQTSTYEAPNDFHAHGVPVPEILGGPFGNPVYYSTSFGLNVIPGGGGGVGGTADPTSTNLSHAHQVSIPTHSHDVTPAINTQYGIYREASGNTLDLTQIEYQVNGDGWRNISFEATSGGGGWYSLDITRRVRDGSTLRPLSENNMIELRGTVERTATIDAQLSVRDIIQAIAYR